MCNAGVLTYSNLIGKFKGETVMVRLAKEDMCERSLTVKETMLETRVDNAEGMNVSCLGIGLMRRSTFCTAVPQPSAEASGSIFQMYLISPRLVFGSNCNI